jgi:hypothetical protein
MGRPGVKERGREGGRKEKEKEKEKGKLDAGG